MRPVAGVPTRWRRPRSVAGDHEDWPPSGAVGRGPVFWLLNSEIYPPRARARAASVAPMVSQSFLPLSELIGQGPTLWFVIRRVPETKHRTFAQISESLRHRQPGEQRHGAGSARRE
ncbi:hypothetical protein [Streptosporangium saharense]|uniref:hypothetical protein n=1 Tax=Streptosporangium saharense TaxID=1706840 RepID=UPI00331C5254